MFLYFSYEKVGGGGVDYIIKIWARARRGPYIIFHSFRWIRGLYKIMCWSLPSVGRVLGTGRQGSLARVGRLLGCAGAKGGYFGGILTRGATSSYSTNHIRSWSRILNNPLRQSGAIFGPIFYQLLFFERVFSNPSARLCPPGPKPSVLGEPLS